MLVFSLAGAPLSISQDATWAVNLLYCRSPGMVWDLANGAGIPAPSDATDVCVSKHQSALIRGDGDSSSTVGPKA